MNSTTYIDVPVIGDGKYPIVETYADLPDYTTVPGQIYVVATSTGMMPRRYAGFYLSTSSGWSYLGDFSAATIKQLYESNPDTNAFTDADKTELDSLAAGAGTSASLAITLNQDGSVQPGSLVVSSGVANTVTALQGNSYSGLVLGVCNATPDSMHAVVQVAGVYTGNSYTPFTPGLAVFVGLDGLPTTTPPTTGDIQGVGIALSSAAFSVTISASKVTRT